MQTVAPSPVYNNIQQMQLSAQQSAQPNVQTSSSQNVKQKQSFGSTVLESALDVGKTVAGGVAIGAVSGGVASLLPFDNTDLIVASLHETILDAARNFDTLPDELANAGEAFNMAKGVIEAQKGYQQIKNKEILMSAQLKLAEALDDSSIKTTISELVEILKDTGVDIKIPADTVLDSNSLEALKTDALLKIGEAINKNPVGLDDAAKNAAIENIMNAKNMFIESIKKFIKEAPAGDGLLSSAKTQAKIASSVNLMGKAISFAVLIALITKIFEVFQPKKDKQETQAPSNAAPATQMPQGSMQTNGNVWNMFSQSLAQGPNSPQNNFNKFMLLG